MTDTDTDRARLLTIGKLSFLTGMTAGIYLTTNAFQSALATLDHRAIAARFSQLCDDWSAILNERLDTPDSEWNDVQMDLQQIRMEDALKRAKTVFFGE